MFPWDAPLTASPLMAAVELFSSSRISGALVDPLLLSVRPVAGVDETVARIISSNGTKPARMELAESAQAPSK